MRNLLYRLRSLTRKLGLNSILFKIIYWNQSYEKHFDNFISSNIKPGDCVYDIAANVGHYTAIFSSLVGNTGKVVAFEPSAINYKVLVTNTNGIFNVTNLNIGLASKKEKMFFQQGFDDLGATSKFSINSLNDFSEFVDVDTLNNIVNYQPFPNIIKIDVEGFEIEVLKKSK